MCQTFQPLNFIDVLHYDREILYYRSNSDVHNKIGEWAFKEKGSSNPQTPKNPKSFIIKSLILYEGAW